MDTEGAFFRETCLPRTQDIGAWLVFVFKIISTFIGQKTKILFYACVEERCSASLTVAREKQT